MLWCFNSADTESEPNGFTRGSVSEQFLHISKMQYGPGIALYRSISAQRREDRLSADETNRRRVSQFQGLEQKAAV
jgi:hypothetical protein